MHCKTKVEFDVFVWCVWEIGKKIERCSEKIEKEEKLE